MRQLNNRNVVSESSSNFWGMWTEPISQEQLEAMAEQGATAENSTGAAAGAGSVNDGRRNNDGAKFWKDILVQGANVITQFGNQYQREQFPQNDFDENQDRFRKETKILGMHPITFGIAAVTTIVVGGIVAYNLTKGKEGAPSAE